MCNAKQPNEKEGNEKQNYRSFGYFCTCIPNCILDYTFILLLGYPGFKSGSEGNSISRFQHSYCRNIWKWIYCITRSFVQRDGERDLFVEHCEDHLCRVLHHGASHVTSPAPICLRWGHSSMRLTVFFCFYLICLQYLISVCALQEHVAGSATPNYYLRA